MQILAPIRPAAADSAMTAAQIASSTPSTPAVTTDAATAATKRPQIVIGPLAVDAQAATGAILSGVALAGRLLLVFAAGAATGVQLFVLLVIGAVACAMGTKASAVPSVQGFSRLLARVGQRAGAVQVLLSLLFLGLLI